MSAATSLSQLSDIVTNLETWVAQLNDPQYTNDELSNLNILSTRLTNATSSIQKRTGSYKPSCRAEVWESSEAWRKQAKSAVQALIHDRRFKQSALFRRNIIIIFGGPKYSEFDSNQMKARKEATSIRCERLRRLEPNKIIAWALSYRATSWAVGSMGSEMFDCLVEAIEFTGTPWPPVVLEVLHKLHNNDLRESTEFSNFLRGK